MGEIVSFDPKAEQLDNTIQFVSEGSYKADNGKVQTEFLETGNQVTFCNNGREVVWKPKSLKYVDEFGMEDTVYDVEDVPLEVKGNYARFNRSFPDVDDWFIVENDRLKHNILIQGFQRDPMPWFSGHIDFVIGGQLAFDSGLTVIANGQQQTESFETDGAIELFDGNTLIFTLPKVIAFDSALDRNMAYGKYRVTQNEEGNVTFDIVMDNDWIASLDRVYPLVIDPTVIVASGYSLAGNGGRKGVELENGWIVAGVIDNSGGIRNIHLYVSKDRGASFSLLNTYSRSEVINDISLVAKGNKTYVCFGWGGTGVYSYYVDENGTRVGTFNINTAEQSLSGLSSIINGDELHLTYSSKNAYYPNNFNIRYAKGTINADGWVAWGAAQQITTLNTSDANVISPTIIIRADGKPSIIMEYTFTKAIHINNYTTAWGTNSSGLDKTIFDGNSYVQSSSSAIFVPQSINGLANGLIVNAWHGVDATHSTTNYIRVSRSIDNGATWTTMQKLVPGTNASLSADKNGKLYIEYQDGANRKRITSTNNGETWSATLDLGVGSNPNMLQNPNYNSNVVGSVYMDSSTVKYDGFSLNDPPTAPTNLTPRGTPIDRTQITRLSWQHNDSDSSDTQAKYDLRWRQRGATAWNDITATTPNNYYDVPANTFPAGEIEWQVRTFDQVGEVSPYSDVVMFNAATKAATPTITSPTEGQTVNGANPTVTWNALGQVEYHLKVLSAADALLWEDQQISTTRTKTITYNLANLTIYKLQLAIKDGTGLWSDFTTVSFNVSYTTAKKPTADSVSDSARGSIALEAVNDNNAGYSNPLAANFVGKVSGSTVENPHKIYGGDYPTLQLPSSFVYETSNVGYSLVSSVNGEVATATVGTNGAIAQWLYSYNVIEEIKRKTGFMLTVAQAKDVITALTANWYGWGSGPSGYNAGFRVWGDAENQWANDLLYTMNSNVTKLSYGIPQNEVKNVVDNNAFVHFLAYAMEASNGTTASTINTDYAELLISYDYKKLINTLPKVMSNEYYRKLMSGEWVKIGATQPGYYGENLLPPFTEWELNENTVITKPYELWFTATAQGQNNTIKVKCSPNATYYFSGSNTGGDFLFAVFDDNDNLLSSFYPSGTVFITPSNADYIQIFAGSGSNTSGTFIYSNPLLVKGNTAKPFTPAKYGSFFTDYQPKPNETEQYFVRAVGDNDTFIDSDILTAETALDSAQIALASDPVNYVNLKGGTQLNNRQRVQRSVSQFAGREYGVAEYGEQKENDLSLTYIIDNEADLQQLENMIDARETLLFRNRKGRKLFVSVEEINITERPKRWEVTFNTQQVDYKEGV